jgi:hypothetical protein
MASFVVGMKCFHKIIPFTRKLIEAYLLKD